MLFSLVGSQNWSDSFLATTGCQQDAYINSVMELGVVNITSYAHIIIQHVTLEVVREDSVSAVIVESAESQKHGNKLALAREAFKSQDPDLSRLAHELGGAQEMHQRAAGQYLKAAVFGGLDGIITTFAVVASVTGANLATGVVIVMVLDLFVVAVCTHT